jgi:hypothetical protein
VCLDVGRKDGPLHSSEKFEPFLYSFGRTSMAYKQEGSISKNLKSQSHF